MTARWLVLFVVVFALIGCGGKHGSNGPIASPFIIISWPARSKTSSSPTVTAPSSALSVSVTCTSISTPGDVASLAENRQATLEAYTDNEVLKGTVPIGHVQLVINFYAQQNEQGAIVATATTDGTVDNLNGSLVDGNGNPLTVSLATTIKTVEITAPSGSSSTLSPSTGTLVPVNGTVQLGFNAYDQNNALVAVTPGSGTFQAQTASVASVTPTGLLTGVKSGTTLIGCQVDGVYNTGQWQFTANVPVAPITTIAWGARSRTVALTSAESASIAITSVPPAGVSYAAQTCTITQDRNLANLAAFNQSVTGSTDLPVGPVTVTATFYDEPGEQGDVVGTLSLPVSGAANPQIASAGTLESSTGQTITIQGNTNVGSVVITAPTTLVYDPSASTQTTEQLTFTCYTGPNGTGTVLTNVSAGSATFSGGGSTVGLTADGIATPKAGGTQTGVTCTVDGVASPSVSIPVNVIPSATIGWGARSEASTTNPRRAAGGPRSRTTNGLSSAVSVDITITPTSGSPITLTEERDLTTANLPAYTQTYAFATALPTGTVSISANFYDMPGGSAGQNGVTGDQVGTYSLTGATLTSTGALQTASGSAITIYGNTLIDRVVITPPTTMQVNTTQQLMFTAYENIGGTDTPLQYLSNGNGQAAADFATVGTSSVISVTQSGLVTAGNNAGSQALNCTIDGVTSPNVTITVQNGTPP